MHRIPNQISIFFDKNFKKRFTVFACIPLIWSIIFLTDFYLLPDSNHKDSIIQISNINVSSNIGGTRVRTNRKIGYKYITKNQLKFSTAEKNLGSSEIQVTSSPVFNTVKSVTIENKQIEISSGFNGISKVILVFYNFIIIVSILYIFVKKKISENARLNLIFLNFLMLLFWISMMVKFGV